MKIFSTTPLDAPSAPGHFPLPHIPSFPPILARLRVHRRLSLHAAYVVFACLALAIIGLHMQHFVGRPYRQDEAWIVQASLDKYGAQQIVQWVANDIHPPLWVIIANAWVDLFGQSEVITRYLSTLF